MPFKTFEGITIFYMKPSHLPFHFDIAYQIKLMMATDEPFTFVPDGKPDYTFTIKFNSGKRFKITTRRVDLSDKFFKNIVSKIDPLPDATDSS